MKRYIDQWISIEVKGVYVNKSEVVVSLGILFCLHPRTPMIVMHRGGATVTFPGAATGGAETIKARLTNWSTDT